MHASYLHTDDEFLIFIWWDDTVSRSSTAEDGNNKKIGGGYVRRDNFWDHSVYVLALKMDRGTVKNYFTKSIVDIDWQAGRKCTIEDFS